MHESISVEAQLPTEIIEFVAYILLLLNVVKQLSR